MRFLPAVLFFWLAAGLPAATVFRVALPGPPVDVAGLRTLEASGRPLLLALGDGLLGFDPVTGLVKPGLAASWTVQEGGTTWVFTLKPARWSDGTSLTAADFVSAWKRAGVLATLLEAPDAKTLRVVFPEPLADVSVLAGPRYQLLPDPSDPRRGAGPFVPEPQIPGLPWVLVKNPQFREAKSILLDRLEFRFTTSSAEASALFRDGLTDWVPRGGGPGILLQPDLKNSVVSPGWGAVFLRLNLRLPRLGDAGYRQSLSSVLDRTRLARELRGPALVPSTGLVPSVRPPGPVKPVPLPLGPVPEPTLTILHPWGETYRLIAEGVADQWKRLGLSVETKAASHAQVLADRASGTFEVVLTGWLGDFPDPTAFLSLFRSGAGTNDTGWSQPAFDTLLDQLIGLPPGKAREAVLTQAQAVLAAEVPVIPLFSYAAAHQIDLKKWSGWTANPTDIHPWQGVGPRKR